MSDNDAIVYYNNPTPVDPNQNLNVPPAERTVKDRFNEVDLALPSPLQVLANPEQAEARVRPLQNLGQDSSKLKTAYAGNIAEQARLLALAQEYENQRKYAEGRASTEEVRGRIDGVLETLVSPLKKIGEAAEPLTRAYASAGAGHYAFNLNSTNKDIARTNADAAVNVAGIQSNGQIQAATITSNAGVQIASIQTDGTIEATKITAESNQKITETQVAGAIDVTKISTRSDQVVANINGRWGEKIAKSTGPSMVITNTNTNLTSSSATSESSPVVSPEITSNNRLKNAPRTSNSLTSAPVTDINVAATGQGGNGGAATSTANPILTANPVANGYGGTGGAASSTANPILTANPVANATGTGGSANLHNEVVLPAPPITTN